MHAKLLPAIVRVALAGVGVGERVFVGGAQRGRRDVYRDAEGREFLGVCIQSEIEMSNERSNDDPARD
ncbi:hypothetical protein LA345_37505 (plasmid) [Burkholderia vietnamiensis]|uniref:hypothetical protein n=1 Tax=Burkholderia ambifaria TaxID=152480 RepID=UPI002FE08235|nr:hypothetical protein [Burkholderia vietnamiensis]